MGMCDFITMHETRKVEIKISNIKYIEKSDFNFPQFLHDIKPILRLKEITLSDLSKTRYFKGANYLSNALNDGKIQARILYDLAEYLGVRLKDYEIVLTPYAEKMEQNADKQVIVGETWTCTIDVNKEFETAMVKITLPNGESVTGRSFLYGTDNTGILQSISYAAHMCYKLVQQGKIEQMSSGDDTENKKLNFKDWITKYEDCNSPYGKLARYIQSHYDAFPSSGEKNMKCYLMQNQGYSHVSAFTTLFKQYVAWDKANYKNG